MSMVTGTVMLAMHLLKMKEKVTNCQALREKEFLPCALPPVTTEDTKTKVTSYQQVTCEVHTTQEPDQHSVPGGGLPRLDVTHLPPSLLRLPLTMPCSNAFLMRPVSATGNQISAMMHCWVTSMLHMFRMW